MIPPVMTLIGTRAEEAQFDHHCHGRYRAQLALLCGTYVADKDRELIVRAIRTPAFRRGTTPEHLKVAGELRDKVTQILKHAFRDRHPVQMQARTLSIRLGNNWQHSGEPDLVYVSGVTAIIFWFEVREGAVAPDASSNIVLRDMAVLLGRSAANPSMVSVCSIDRVNDFSVMTYDRAAIARLEADMFQRLAQMHAANPRRSAGWPQCDNCTALTHCREAAELVTTTVREASGGLPETASQAAVDNTLPTVATDRLERFRRLQPLVTKLCAALPRVLDQRKAGG